MAKYPAKQERLRNEIKGFLPKIDSPLEPESLNRIPYLKACLKESMRVQPVTEGNMRAAAKDIVLGGYQIPKHVWIIM